MSSSHNAPQTVEQGTPAERAAQSLRERIGQENVSQSSVLASRRLDEALQRLERARAPRRKTQPPVEPAAGVPEPAARMPEPAAHMPEPVSHTPCETPAPEKPEASRRPPEETPDRAATAAHCGEMSDDAIEAMFAQPIDVMILSTTAKIPDSSDRKPEPNAVPEPEPMLIQDQPEPVGEPPVEIKAETKENPTPDMKASVPPNAATQAPTGVSLREFAAAWQVDEFIVPSTIEKLFLTDSVAEQLARQLAEARTDGLRTIAITSATEREGRSTVALGLALSIAFSGIRVALVDADPAGVKIASELQLDLDHSWPEAIRSQTAIEEVAVASQADSLTLLPLLDRDAETGFADAELEKALLRLRQSFDMIVVDCGASAVSRSALCGTALIVRDTQRASGSDEVAALTQALHDQGVRGVGVIENFCR
ncbi:tyrosine-protein kinase family protein [Allorhodopirellula solitaria]|uniref:CobQ/CobB/MinD/ParA nucleotide binding domain protein n=1 Tax=Allorhodopirellula solitaria TaxID=2527987 RepID=A0A5C5YKC1_9BACT|nr:AAA family ATPase [Allorhodopirellula solitaria]TWT75314.1 CobQ/CobB/MinD/ParA nucleotide binding domain protein [Allorhodopirellula solitaria]